MAEDEWYGLNAESLADTWEIAALPWDRYGPEETFTAIVLVLPYLEMVAASNGRRAGLPEILSLLIAARGTLKLERRQRLSDMNRALRQAKVDREVRRLFTRWADHEFHVIGNLSQE